MTHAYFRIRMGLAGVVLLMIACQLSPIDKIKALLPFHGPEITQHTEPTLTVNTSLYEQSDCEPYGSSMRLCKKGSQFNSLGCTSLTQPGAVLGGLDPALPLAICQWNPGERIEESQMEGKFIYNNGCSMPIFVRMAVEQNGETRLLQNMDDLQSLYAPISSPEEALSYAVAATGYKPLYGLQPDRNLRYLVDEIEDTHVELTKDGYRVNLYFLHLCGCGPHPTFLIPVDVSADGKVFKGAPQPVFEDPKQDDLCVD